MLADGASFPILNAGKKNQARRTCCHDCHNRQKKRDREERGIGLPTVKPPEQLQTAKYTRWSKEDDAYLAEHITTMSYENLAIKLGRSLKAVYKRRDILGLSTVRVKHRVEKPWRITKSEA